jgi:hypothetical protein
MELEMRKCPRCGEEEEIDISLQEFYCANCGAFSIEACVRLYKGELRRDEIMTISEVLAVRRYLEVGRYNSQEREENEESVREENEREDELSREHRERKEKNREKNAEKEFEEQEEKIETADVLAIKKGTPTISRTFGLRPDTNSKEEEKEVKKKLKRHFIKIRELKNIFLKEMLKDARENGIENYKGNSIMDANPNFYGLGLNKLKANQYSSYKLKQYAKLCASYDAYFVARNWIIRKENLATIINGIIDEIHIGWIGDFALKFLKGDRFKKKK